MEAGGRRQGASTRRTRRGRRLRRAPPPPPSGPGRGNACWRCRSSPSAGAAPYSRACLLPFARGRHTVRAAARLTPPPAFGRPPHLRGAHLSSLITTRAAPANGTEPNPRRPLRALPPAQVLNVGSTTTPATEIAVWANKQDARPACGDKGEQMIALVSSEHLSACMHAASTFRGVKQRVALAAAPSHGRSHACVSGLHAAPACFRITGSRALARPRASGSSSCGRPARRRASTDPRAPDPVPPPPRTVPRAACSRRFLRTASGA